MADRFVNSCVVIINVQGGRKLWFRTYLMAVVNGPAWLSLTTVDYIVVLPGDFATLLIARWRQLNRTTSSTGRLFLLHSNYHDLNNSY
jgi:hypothetical protein